MSIKKAPFKNYKLDSERTEPKPDIVPLRLSELERTILVNDKEILQETRDSTAIKQLMLIGHHCITSPLNKQIIGIIFKNKRLNRRKGIYDFVPL